MERVVNSYRAQQLLQLINAMDPTDQDGRRRLLAELFGAFGEGSEIRPPVQCDYGHRIFVGVRCRANPGLTILDAATVTIGDDVQIGPNVQLLTEGRDAALPIVIGDNVWLGGGVIVCPGVTIGPDTVVSPGSLVVEDLPARVVAAGSPARVIRPL
jgi:maltose O-acetyltransferase